MKKTTPKDPITLFGKLSHDHFQNLGYSDISKNNRVYVNGSLQFENYQINDFPLHFGRVTESVNIKDNHFEYFSNKSPRLIKGSLWANRNRISSLKNMPKVETAIVLECNALTKLEYLPTELSSLNFAGNEITSLNGITEHIEDHLIISNNPIKSLRDIHKQLAHCRTIDVSDTPIEEGGIGLLLVKNLEFITCDKTVKIFFDDDRADEFIHPQDPFSNRPKYHPRRYRAMTIINKYLALGGGKEYLLDCANELENAGLEKFALL